MDRFDMMERIDDDEGREDGPFYVEALPCESCGKPIEHRTPADWAPELMVGTCCALYVESPEVPVCPVLWEALKRCTSVSEIQEVWRAHQRKQPGTAPAPDRKKVAA